jgi:formamidopyrimidine-DNA glycosylase
MPELPEVETFKRYMDATSLHQRIVGVEVESADLLKSVSARDLSRRLKGRCFESTRRHGKHLFVRADDVWLRLHFGMTGSLRYFKGEEKTPPHTRILFVFESNYRLAFDDQRKFGEVGLIDNAAEYVKKRGLGPDALDFDFSGFKNAIDKHHGAIKSILMNQRIIAGIGNIYADEILFHARLHPASKTGSLNGKTMKRLFHTMRRVIGKAIEYQSDAGRMPNSWLLSHRGKGGKCPRCGHKLKSFKVGGRTSWFCPHDQHRYARL